MCRVDITAMFETSTCAGTRPWVSLIASVGGRKGVVLGGQIRAVQGRDKSIR